MLQRVIDWLLSREPEVIPLNTILMRRQVYNRSNPVDWDKYRHTVRPDWRATRFKPYS